VASVAPEWARPLERNVKVGDVQGPHDATALSSGTASLVAHQEVRPSDPADDMGHEEVRAKARRCQEPPLSLQGHSASILSFSALRFKRTKPLSGSNPGGTSLGFSSL